MDSSRPLVPSFIKKIDRKLLLNSPSVWSTRTHLVLYFSVLFAAIVSLFCLLIYRDARVGSGTEILIGFLTLISFIGFIFWLIYLLRFNVFKRYGNWITGDGIRTFALFFVNILALVAIPFIPLYIESAMANKQYTAEELVNDINELNINANRLEYDLLPTYWKMDTLRIVTRSYTIDRVSKDTIWESVGPSDNVYNGNTKYATEKDKDIDLANADSIIKKNDSLYYLYTAPDYTPVSCYTLNNFSSVKIKNNLAIYNEAIKNYTKPDREALTKRMKLLEQKYHTSEFDYQYYGDIETEHTQIISKKYKLRDINNTIDTIANKKYQWKDALPISLHLMFYFTLVLSLLVFIFRHSTVKTFFLSLLATVILSILTSLFIVMTSGNVDTLFILFILYFIIFAILGFSTISAKTRSIIQGIGLNLFLFGLPFMPLVITAYYFEIKDRENRYGNYIYTDRTPYYIAAEIIGFALLLILIEPLFKRLYKAWYATPEE